MKKLLLIFILTFIVFAGYSQNEQQDLSKDYYLQKSKNKHTTAWVLLGAEAAVVMVGSLIAIEEFSDTDWFFEDSSKIDTGFTLVAVGAASSLASIPFFISAGKNSRKASSISMESQRYIIPGEDFTGIQPALSFKIEF